MCIVERVRRILCVTRIAGAVNSAQPIDRRGADRQAAEVQDDRADQDDGPPASAGVAEAR